MLKNTKGTFRDMLIDIHNHSLFGVDDGPKEMEETIALLKEAKKQGVSTIIFTPHFRHGMFPYPLEAVDANYKQAAAEAEKLGIRTFLGCEYHVDSEMLDAFMKGRCHSVGDGDYVLTEYSHQSEYAKMVKYTKDMVLNGYIPVVAHVERYECLVKHPELCLELSDLGAMIQMNAGAVLGYEGKIAQKFAKKMLKNHWADIIASDTHDLRERTNHMAECYGYVERKYGEAYANRLFIKNPNKLIRDLEE